MRKIEYISPSGYDVYKKDMTAFYMRYLADIREPKNQQLQVMSIGSAFDAYAKSAMYSKLIGNRDAKFSFEALFESQVEPQNRTWAREHGKHVYTQYVNSGALADVLLEMNGAIGEPRFETEIRGKVSTQLGDMTFTGKPDVFFINKNGVSVIFDWKVNGYLSNSPVSPMKGYIRLKPGFTRHPDAVMIDYKGINVNKAMFMETGNASWATQLSIYAWLSGEQVGGQFVVAIDQVCCNTKKGTLYYPELRFASHRAHVSPIFQHAVFGEANQLWKNIQSDHYFQDLTLEESQSRCKLLDQRAKDQWSPSEFDKQFNELIK